MSTVIALIGSEGIMGSLRKDILKSYEEVGKVTLLEYDIENISEMNPGDIDKFVVCSNTESHYHILDALIPNKKPIFVERPLSNDIKKAKELFSKARQFNTYIYIGWQKRENEYIVKAKDYIDAGTLSDIKTIIMKSSSDYNVPMSIASSDNFIIKEGIIDDLNTILYFTDNKLPNSSKVKTLEKKIVKNGITYDLSTSASFVINWDFGLTVELQYDLLGEGDSKYYNQYLKVDTKSDGEEIFLDTSLFDNKEETYEIYDQAYQLEIEHFIFHTDNAGFDPSIGESEIATLEFVGFLLNESKREN